MAKNGTSWSKDNPGPGRPLGAQNQLTRTVKEVVLTVFNNLQVHPTSSLQAWAEANPGDFYPIAAKLIPTEINAKINKVKLEIVRTTPTTDQQTSSESTESD